MERPYLAPAGPYSPGGLPIASSTSSSDMPSWTDAKRHPSSRRSTQAPATTNAPAVRTASPARRNRRERHNEAMRFMERLPRMKLNQPRARFVSTRAKVALFATDRHGTRLGVLLQPRQQL